MLTDAFAVPLSETVTTTVFRITPGLLELHSKNVHLGSLETLSFAVPAHSNVEVKTGSLDEKR